MAESVRTVDRALDVLLCFTRQTPRLTMTQIAEQVGMHKSTVHRLLATLENRRFVERDPDTGVYQLGIRLLQMAYLTLESHDLRWLAAPFLRQLSKQYRETIDLGILDDTDVVFLDVVESPQRVKLAASIGQRLPAFATASGKAILAYLPDDAARNILNRGMPRLTQHTITSQEVFFGDLRQVREQGFALSIQGLEMGINAVAAPILDPKGQPIGAVSVAGPTFRLTQERMVEIGPVLSSITQEIAREVEMAKDLDWHHNGDSSDSPIA